MHRDELTDEDTGRFVEILKINMEPTSYDMYLVLDQCKSLDIFLDRIVKQTCNTQPNSHKYSIDNNEEPSLDQDELFLKKDVELLHWNRLDLVA